MAPPDGPESAGLGYLPPEVVPDPGAEPRFTADVYGLGVILYELLAGRPPFDADSDMALMKAQLEKAPPPLRALAPAVPLAPR